MTIWNTYASLRVCTEWLAGALPQEPPELTYQNMPESFSELRWSSLLKDKTHFFFPGQTCIMDAQVYPIF